MLDFESAIVSQPLSLSYCEFPEKITLTDARTKSLKFSGSRFSSIVADRLVAEGDVFLFDIFCSGEVDLRSATVHGT